ncbi:MAG: flagellar protein FlgN [Treponema sp.]|nr:flagellar protein FlgN [Treponema sp.]
MAENKKEVPFMENPLALSIVLLKELELLEKIPPLQVLIRDAVIKREWTNYEVLMETVGEIASRFEILDGERAALFTVLTEGDDPESFYAYAARLPEREREELSALYRKLKMTTLQIKVSNDTLMEYLREAKSAVTGILETAYPDRRGKLYSRTGTERQADMRSVVVNHSF